MQFCAAPRTENTNTFHAIGDPGESCSGTQLTHCYTGLSSECPAFFQNSVTFK